MYKSIFLTVVIPTLNRSRSLEVLLSSITKQVYPIDRFEVIVIDNGSDDTTEDVCKYFSTHFYKFRYVFAANPGLHIGRNLGLKLAKGHILVYADDDIEAYPTWLERIAQTFEKEDVALVGGRNLPKFESEPPSWILDMWRPKRNGHRILSYLSILDLGEETKRIPPQYVFGCNYSIRKSVLLESGGFHPDAFPKNLIQFRGDGETHVSNYIKAKNLKTIYNPKASVYHRVPEKRMTLEYFCYRAYIQGISDSYSAMRKPNRKTQLHHSEPQASKYGQRFQYLVEMLKEKSTFDMILRKARTLFGLPPPTQALVKKKINLAHKAGYAFHQRMAREDPEIMKWVLREDYFGKNGEVPLLAQ